jgi:hypothetical protein
MAPTDSGALVSDVTLEELTERGQALYEAKLKTLLEPQYNGQYVVIHVDTEDYAIANTFTQAHRAMMRRGLSKGRLFGRKIGDEPDNDFVARFLIGESGSQRPK